MKKRKSVLLGEQVMVDGMMTFGKLETGLRTLDFVCCEDVVAEPFSGTFKVQGMRDGNVYMEQKPKRARNKSTFREDNSSFSIGRNKYVYFVFSMPVEQIEEVPERLVRQASSIAQKIIRELILKK